MGEIRCTVEDFSRQKTIFLTQNQTQFKNADFFFLRTVIPPKDLVFLKKFFLAPFKSAKFSRQKT